MKKLIMLFLCLALISLACLDTSAPVVATVEPSRVATRLEVTRTATATAARITPTLTSPAELCAVVVALKAQNLRAFPGTNGRVIEYLHNGDLVQVVEQVSADWWHVKRGEDIGFAKATYLKETSCKIR